MGNQNISNFFIYEASQKSVIIATITPTKQGNNLIATYTFTTALLNQLPSDKSEFTFSFSSALIQEDPKIKILIQTEDLLCPTIKLQCNEVGPGFIVASVELLPTVADY